MNSFADVREGMSTCFLSKAYFFVVKGNGKDSSRVSNRSEAVLEIGARSARQSLIACVSTLPRRHRH